MEAPYDPENEYLTGSSPWLAFGAPWAKDTTRIGRSAEGKIEGVHSRWASLNAPTAVFAPKALIRLEFGRLNGGPQVDYGCAVF